MAGPKFAIQPPIARFQSTLFQLWHKHGRSMDFQFKGLDTPDIHDMEEVWIQVIDS